MNIDNIKMSEEEIMAEYERIDTPLGCHISIGAYPVLVAIANAATDKAIKKILGKMGEVKIKHTDKKPIGYMLRRATYEALKNLVEEK